MGAARKNNRKLLDVVKSYHLDIRSSDQVINICELHSLRDVLSGCKHAVQRITTWRSSESLFHGCIGDAHNVS